MWTGEEGSEQGGKLWLEWGQGLFELNEEVWADHGLRGRSPLGKRPALQHWREAAVLDETP